MDTGTIIKAIALTSGGVVGFLFGGWSQLLTFLVAAVVIDYISGVLAAFVEGKNGTGKGLNSSVGFIGIARKVFIFLIVAVAHIADKSIGSDIIMTATIFFYLANELLSILENGVRIGMPVPDVLKKAIEVIKDKGGNNNVRPL